MDKQHTNSTLSKSDVSLESSYSKATFASDISNSEDSPIVNTIFSVSTDAKLAKLCAAMASADKIIKSRLEAVSHFFKSANASSDDTFIVAYTAAIFGVEFAEQNARGLNREYDRDVLGRLFAEL